MADNAQKKILNTPFKANGYITKSNDHGNSRSNGKPSGNNSQGGNNKPGGNGKPAIKTTKQDFCNYCRSKGHTKENCSKLKEKLAKGNKDTQGGSGKPNRK